MIVDCAIHRHGHRTEGPADLSDALAGARAVGGFVRIGLYEPSERGFDLVTQEFALHPPAVEDALNAHQRPKLEVYDDSLSVVLKPVVCEAASGTVPAGEIMVFMGDCFVVTVRHGEGSPPAAVRRRLEDEPEMPDKGPTAVLYAISDAVVDRCLGVATELGTDLEELEAEVFRPEGGGSRDIASRIYGFKRQVLEFRRATGPLGPPLSRPAPGSSARRCPSRTTRRARSSGTWATTSCA